MEINGYNISPRADLREADLSEANLSGANLSWADLSEANLRLANLSWANLSGANLRGANLSWANLRGADLSWANLSEANLRVADLSCANLSEANLRGAVNVPTLPWTIIVPEGDLIVYKKLREGVCTLLIPRSAKRVNATGRKCRAEFAVVEKLPSGFVLGTSIHDENFRYRLGETVKPVEPFCEDRWDECSSGIHFFLTREEAENY